VLHSLGAHPSHYTLALSAVRVSTALNFSLSLFFLSLSLSSFAALTFTHPPCVFVFLVVQLFPFPPPSFFLFSFLSSYTLLTPALSYPTLPCQVVLYLASLKLAWIAPFNDLLDRSLMTTLRAPSQTSTPTSSILTTFFFLQATLGIYHS